MRRLWSAITMLLFVLTSCEHKELCLLHNHSQRVEVRFDWRDAPDASPKGMSVFFYDAAGKKEVIHYNIKGTEGAVITVEPGEYRVACYNSDSEYTTFGGISKLATHEAYTSEGIVGGITSTVGSYPRPDAAKDEQIRLCPDMLWGYVEEEIQQIELSDEDVLITLYPHELTATYTYEVRGVENTDRISYFLGMLSGMSQGMFIATETLKNDVVSFPFEGDHIGENSLTGTFYTFGVPEGSEKANYISFYLWMKEGKGWAYHFVVTDQIMQAPDKKHVHLIIEGLSLPTTIDSEDGGGGFKPSFEDWPEEVIDVM